MIRTRSYVLMVIMLLLFFSCSKNQQIDKLIVTELNTQKQEEIVLKSDTSIYVKPTNSYQFDINLKNQKYNKSATLHLQNVANKELLYTYPMKSLGLNGRYTVTFHTPEIYQPKEFFIFWIGEMADKADANVYSIVITGAPSTNLTQTTTPAANTNVVEQTPASTATVTKQEKVEKTPASTPVKSQPSQVVSQTTDKPKSGFYIASVACINVTKGSKTETSMNDNSEYKFKIELVKTTKGAVTTLSILKNGTSYQDLELVKKGGYYTTDSAVKFEPGKYTFQAIDENDNQSKTLNVNCIDNDVTGPSININPSDTAIYNFSSGKNYNFRCKISDPSRVSKAELKLNDGSRDQSFLLERNRDDYWQANNIVFNDNATLVKATLNAWDNDNDYTGDEAQSTVSFTIKKSFYLTNKVKMIANQAPAKNITLLIQRQGIAKNEIKKTDANGEFTVSGLNGEKIDFWQDTDSTKVFTFRIQKDKNDLTFELKSDPIKPKLTLNFTVLDKSIMSSPFKVKFTAYVIPKPDKIIKYTEETAAQISNVYKYETFIDSKQISAALSGNKAKVTVNIFFKKENGVLYQSGNYAWAYSVSIPGNDNVSVDGSSERFGMVNFPIEAVNAPEVTLNTEDAKTDDYK